MCMELVVRFREKGMLTTLAQDCGISIGGAIERRVLRG